LTVISTGGHSRKWKSESPPRITGGRDVNGKD
jgi:hypothetical protein